MSQTDPAFWDRVKQVFTAACESGDRDRILAGEEPAVQAEVRALLATHDEPDRRFDAEPAARHARGELLAGRYRIERFLVSCRS